MKLLSVLFFILTSYSVQAANNLHLVDSAPNGYAMYRASVPDAADIKTFCNLGISEIMVLSGNAEEAEFKYQAACPSLRVVYNKKQSAKIPLDRNFLEAFDKWVESSQAAGRKIAIRCQCGCHRTGRLAAYYEMKFKSLGVAQALANMNRLGKYMYLFPGLVPQVRSLEDYIYGRGCSVAPNYCVQ